MTTSPRPEPDSKFTVAGDHLNDLFESTVLSVIEGDDKQPEGRKASDSLNPYLNDTFGRSFDTISNLSTNSVDRAVEGRQGRQLSLIPPPTSRHVSRSPGPATPKTWKGRWTIFWDRNRGVVLVLMAQLFGALMNVTTRLLENSGQGMHPFQILFARMSITLAGCCVYCWWTKVPDFPFGRRDVRLLLVARGVGGFWGVFGLYYSLVYLPLAEATVITFLAPIVACFACSFLINEPFTRVEKICGFISLIGVALIARPTSFFGNLSSLETPAASGTGDAMAASNSTISHMSAEDLVTPAQRLSGVGLALVGVCGAASAYTTIRWIGKRAHPLVSVNYFAVWCTLVSFTSLVLGPALKLSSVGFKLPDGLKEWSLLFSLGVCGFIMQFLLTAGLQHEKSSRATNMVYTQMLFALGFDRLVWGVSPGVWSIIGSSLILGSALVVAVKKNDPPKSKERVPGRRDEERGLVAGIDAVDEDDPGQMRGLQEVQLRTIRV